MWTANNWIDYELLDCCQGERLERWGSKLLIRPEPLATEYGSNRHPGWISWNGRYVIDSKRNGRWETRDLSEHWNISYGSLTFQVGPTKHKQMGLFPEQAVNWEFEQRLISNAGRKIRVLNLFAYTGGATIACAAAGASVCHVDAAKEAVAWAKENARLSCLADSPIRWIVDDCWKFVQREIRRGRKYDAVIMDPPSYGHGTSGRIWKLSSDFALFLQEVIQLLSDEPLFFIVNLYTAGVQKDFVLKNLQANVGHYFGGYIDVQQLALPITHTGSWMPCGLTGCWAKSY